MKTFKQFIAEANLYNSPNNYPSGSVVLINPNNKKTVLSILRKLKIKANDKFIVDDISTNVIESSNTVALVNKPNFWVSCIDKSGDSVVFAMNKSLGNSFFKKGAGTDNKQKFLFTNKELSPDGLNLAGKTFTKNMLIDETIRVLESKYDPDVVEALTDILEVSNSRGDTLKVDSSFFTGKDLATISKDFGEILSAVWIMSTTSFKEVYFPEASNQPLVDFYGVKMGVRYPFSVKSGGGGKVTIQNIIDSLQNRAKTAGTSLEDEKSLGIFNIVRENPMRDGMIKLHQFLESDEIKMLAKIMGIHHQEISLDTINQFTQDKDNDELRNILTPWLNNIGTSIADKIWERPDKVRFIVSPLGEVVWKLLNNNKEIQSSLTSIARKIVLVQVNVDVKTKTIKFKKNAFKDITFKFSWAGYSGGNKLGFLAKVTR